MTHEDEPDRDTRDMAVPVEMPEGGRERGAEGPGSDEERRKLERERKKKELMARLKSKGLGPVHYRWAPSVLVMAGILAIWTNFLVVMEHPPDVGFDTFWDAYNMTGNVFFLFPLLSGATMMVIAIFAYWEPRFTFLSLVPSAMLGMCTSTVYYLVSFALYADPSSGVAATGTPIGMAMASLCSVLAIGLRDRE
ncbi:MAG: hypothetical protein QXS20_08750 [Candidatus Thorarchaeota archaeon]